MNFELTIRHITQMILGKRLERCSFVLMLLTITLGVNTAWGQTDYSGTYYIGSVGFKPASTSDNFYLCPTEGWCYYHATDDFTGTDNGMPFLTTHKCRGDANYNVGKAVWTIEKAPAPNSGYYYIKQALTGKYLVSNGEIRTTGNADRMRVHLESVASENLDDKELFTIDFSDNKYFISPKDVVGGAAERIWLVVNGGNNNSLQGASGKTGGPTGYTNTTGIVGVYTKADTNAPFYLEIPAPTLVYNDGSISISHEFTDVDIYYTTDGKTPTASSTQYSSVFTPLISSTQVKAIAISRVSGIKSTVTTYSLPKLDAPTISAVIPNPSDVTTSGTATITTSVDGATIFYTKGTNPSNPKTNSNTTTGDVSFTGPTVIKAVVGKAGYALSDVTTKRISKVATPTFRDNGNLAIIIESETPNAGIHYLSGDTEPSDPDGSSPLYSSPLPDMKGKYIKAIAIKNENYNSDIASFGPVIFKCAKPVIKRIASDKFTITCSNPASATIHYTIGGSTPTSSDTGIASGAEVNITGSLPLTIKAIALASGFDDSDVTTLVLRDDDLSGSGTTADPFQIATSSDFSRFITKANTDDGALVSYILTADISVSESSSISKTFTGTFDGDFHTIAGYGKPLFNSINDGIVKNVVLDPNTTVSGNGAICNEADGSTKIYNCGVLSGTISGSGNVGGLVGHINSGSSVRVVNCYNFATVSGGATMAGIVGNNEGTVGNVRIALCMMYGDMSGGTSPVYAGNHTNNVSNYTEYNYWRSKASLTYTAYNDQLAIDKDEYLTRFPFYRHILNTHRELAAFFLFGESGETVNNITTDEIAEIGHWALKKDVAPYPIVEEWKNNTKRTIEDIENNLPNTTEKGAGKLLNNIGDDGYYKGDGTKITAMGSSGYLTVNVTIGSKSYSVNLPITDMNEDKYDYTWGKVVLPFANEFSGWTRDYGYVCTGWEITDVGGETSASVSNYNFADRDNKKKDIYHATNNPYIYAQGGNYIVPYDVSTISINAHFAKAFYLSDPTYEVGYKADYTTPTPLGGYVYNSNDPYYHGKKVYTSLSDLVTDPNFTTAANPHEQAIVLVGNYHFNLNLIGASDAGDGAYSTPLDLGKAVTIMSTDEDNNQEPDYGWYTCNTKGRINVPPIRFDFLPNIEMGMSSRVGSNVYPGVGIWHTRGWFELTETCVSNMSQCEINSSKFTTSDDDKKGNNRWIANSGCFVQIVRARTNPCVNLSYIQIGGNAYVKELYPGCHSDNARTNTAVPIVVTGGQVDECYMTGYTAGGKLNGDIYFWCAGGKIKKFLGAYLEEPLATTGTTAGMTAKVDHALIGRFFGGGTSVSARIKGNIDITINNSQVDFYCGGPEFGDMNTGKTVTTKATGTTFGEYYGAGFGGTSITYNKETDAKEYTFPGDVNPFPLEFSNYKRLEKKANYGIGTCYKFEYIYHSSGSKGVARFHTGYAQFSLATTGAVTNTLTNCIIKKLPGTNSLVTKATSGEFYGAGCQGKVDGTVTSTLTNCTIERNAFGGGYKAESNDVEVYTTTPPIYSVYTKETGIFSDFGEFPTPETYTWAQGDATHDGVAGTEGNAGKLFTSKDIKLTDLGNVTGAITLTIDGGYVGGTSSGPTSAVPATATSDAIPAGGSVYGGGNESKSLNNTTVKLKGNAVVYGDVFGGGNKANVTGSATVNIEQ